MVSKRRSIKRQRRQRQQRAYTVKGGENLWLSKIKTILNTFRAQEEQNIDTMNLLDSSEKSNSFDDVGSFIYNGQTYNYHFNTTTGLIKILNSNQTDALCYIVLYDNKPIRTGGVNLYEKIIKDPRTILKQEIEDKDINNTFVQAFTNDKKTKLKFIKTSDNNESSYGTLKEFLIYLEKKYDSIDPVIIDEEEVIRSENINPSGTGNSPVSSTNYTRLELIELSEKLTKALNCVRIPYDDEYEIVIKNVVLYGPTTGGKSRRKISTRQIRDIIKNSIKFGGNRDREGDKTPGPPRQRSQTVINPVQEQPVQEQPVQEQLEQEKLKQLQKKQEEQEEQEKLKQIQNEINEIIKDITLPNGLKIERIEIKLESKYPLQDILGSVGGKSTRRRRQTRMKTRKQYKSRN